MNKHVVKKDEREVLVGLFIEHQINVSTYDTDYANHVSNISYLRWLEDMRLKLFNKYFSLEEFLAAGKTPVIASTSIQYRRPVRLFDKPNGVMWVSAISSASMTIKAELYVGKTLTTTAEHVSVFIDLSTGKPLRLPDLCKQMFLNATDRVPLIR
jgi:acyl-CoA thioester hydrolase